MIKSVDTTTDSLEADGIEFSGTHNFLQSEIQQSIGSIRRHVNSLLSKQKRVAIAVAGGATSGKTSVVTPALLGEFPSTLVISEDDYCIGNTASQKLHGVPNLYVPEDFDPELLADHITQLKQGKGIEKPLYSYEIRERIGSIRIEAHDILVVEGLFLLHPPLGEQFDVRIFIDTNDHTRFIRRLLRQRRNPNQTDLERIMEYCNLSFRHYHELINLSAINADFTVVNDYNVQEGMARCSDKALECLLTGKMDEILKEYPVKRRNKFRTHYYAHHKFTPSEVLSVTEHDLGGNKLKYVPGFLIDKDFVITSSASFDIKDEQFDLRTIGYRSLLTVEGEEIMLVEGGNLSGRVILLSDGRTVLHLVQRQHEDTKAFVTLKNRFMDKGLTLGSNNNFDQWALEDKFKC